MANKPTIFTKVVPIEIAALMKAKGFDWKIKEFYMYTPKAACINSSGGYKDHYSSYIAYSNSEWSAMDKDAKKAFWKGIDDKHSNISASIKSSLSTIPIYSPAANCKPMFIEFP